MGAGARAALAGLDYFAPVFLLGVALGTARTVFAEPHLNALWATLLELPIILTASWMICSRALRRFAVPPEAGARLVMGAVAFASLMAAELALGHVLAGAVSARAPGEFAARFAGLAGQILFGAFPLLQAACATRAQPGDR